MIYTNEKMRIVPFERNKHMTERYRSWMIDPETTKFNSWGLFPYTSAQMESFIHDIEQGSMSRIVWAIEIYNPPREISKNETVRDMPEWSHVGNCSLQGINWINRSCELAIVIGEAKARGRGVGRQACQWMLDHAFFKLNMWRCWTGTAATNAAMREVCVKLGMKQEGVFKDGMFLDGEQVDVIAYGLTRLHYKLLNSYKKESDIVN